MLQWAPGGAQRLDQFAQSVLLKNRSRAIVARHQNRNIPVFLSTPSAFMSDVGNDQAALTAWCVSYVADMLELAPDDVKPNAKFSRIGLDSAMSVQLAVALEERLGIALTPDVIADHPTISRLVVYLSTIRSNPAA